MCIYQWDNILWCFNLFFVSHYLLRHNMGSCSSRSLQLEQGYSIYRATTTIVIQTVIVRDGHKSATTKTLIKVIVAFIFRKIIIRRYY